MGVGLQGGHCLVCSRFSRAYKSPDSKPGKGGEPSMAQKLLALRSGRFWAMPARPQNLVRGDGRDEEFDERRGEVKISITA